MMEKTFLVVGLGSIGQRHFQNLKKLGFKTYGVSSKENEDENVFQSIKEAFSQIAFSHVVICSPTAFHIESLTAILEHNPNFIYIEKPISTDLNGIDDLKAKADLKNITVVVGYDLRFDPGLQKVKFWLDGQAIGRVLSVNAKVGQYLPDWRPHEDHREGMSAKVSAGGGVLLDLVHEWDYLLWLTGPIQRLTALTANNSELEIETEDLCDVLFETQNGVIGTLHLDYWQPNLVRDCLITGTKGSIFWDLSKRQVELRLHQHKENQKFEYVDFDRNDRFISAMSSFANNIEDERLVTFNEGRMSLEMVLKCKESANKKGSIKC